MTKKIQKDQSEELRRAKLEFIFRNEGESQRLRELLERNKKKRDEITTALATIGGKFRPEQKERWDFLYQEAVVDEELAEYLKKKIPPNAVNPVWRWVDYCMDIKQKMIMTTPQLNYKELKTKVIDMHCRDAREIFTELMNDRPAVHLLLGIDLTRSKEVIIEEVKKLVDEYKTKLGVHEAPGKRFKWLSIVRELMEIWDAWAGYGQRRCFHLIASKLKMPKSTVKARWRLAYRLIQNKEFSKEVAKESAVELCAKCKDSSKCYREEADDRMEFYPCAAYLKLTGKSYTREKVLENFDAVADQYIADNFEE